MAGMTIEDEIRKVEERRQKLFMGGGAEAIGRQHAIGKPGKLSARERLALLFDEGTFQEELLWIKAIRTGFDVDQRDRAGDSVVTGIGKINGRPTYGYAHDFTVVGGSMSLGQTHKVTRVMENARKYGIPYVGLIDSGGGAIHDMFGRPARRPIVAGGDMGFTTGAFWAVSDNSGIVPQISVFLGPCVGGSAYSPVMADFVIMRKETSYMSVTGTRVMKAATFVDVTQEELGGAEMHASIAGSNDFLVESDEEGIATCRRLLSYLPQNYREKPPIVNTGDDPNRRDEELLKIVPPDLSGTYDMHEIINRVLDIGSFTELAALYAPSMIIGYGRLDGKTVGIIANNPRINGGRLDLSTSDKEARFIRFCDAFGIPLVIFIDTPGYLPSVEEEHSPQGLLRRAAQPVFALCEATVPMVSVIIGKSWGPGRLAMGTPREGIDMVFSWPQAQVARMDPNLVVEKIWGREIAEAKDPEKERAKWHKHLLDTYIRFPFHAGEYLMVDEIIDPRNTRPMLINRLEYMSNKVGPAKPWRKHSLLTR